MFLQRQISSFVGEGDSTDAIDYSINERVWASQDVYPSKIMVLSDDSVIGDEIIVAASGSAILPLPNSHTDLSRLSFFLRTTQTIKITVTKPDASTSVTLVRAGVAADSNGMFSFTGLVAAGGIVVANPGAVDATIEYFCWDYPPDISVAAAWRDGSQTIGTAPTQ